MPKKKKVINASEKSVNFRQITYDDNHNIIRDEAQGFLTQFTYNKNGKRLTQDTTHPNGEKSSYKYSYDELGRLIMVDQDNSIKHIYYSADTRIEEVTPKQKCNYNKTQDVFDIKTNRIKSSMFVYDDYTNVTEYEYSIDDKGFEVDTETKFKIVDGIKIFIESFRHDVNSENRIIAYQERINTNGEKTVFANSELDENNNVIKQSLYEEDGKLFESNVLSYHKNGCLRKIDTTSNNLHLIFLYDVKGRLICRKEFEENSNVLADNHVFKYNRKGKIIFEGDEERQNYSIYKYDINNHMIFNEITSASEKNGVIYEYDKFGNMSYVLNNIVETRSVFDPSTNKELIISIDGDFTKLCEFKKQLLINKGVIK